MNRSLEQRIDEMMAVQLESTDDDYNRGLYNGMEFIRSMVTDDEPIYVEPDGKLDKAAVERNPERFI